MAKLTESYLRTIIKEELLKEMAKLDPAVSAARAAKAAETRRQRQEFYARMDAKRAAQLAAINKRKEEGFAPLVAYEQGDQIPNPAYYNSEPDPKSGYTNYTLKPQYHNRKISDIYVDKYQQSDFGYVADTNKRKEQGFAPLVAYEQGDQIPNPVYYASEPDPKSGYTNYKLKPQYQNRKISDIYVDKYEQSDFGYERRSR